DENTARRQLAQWCHLDASELPRTEFLRHVIEHSLLAAHRHVFGVFFWFVLMSALGLGPGGGGGRLWDRQEQGARRAGQRQAGAAVAAPVRDNRPPAGAPHRIRLRGG